MEDIVFLYLSFPHFLLHAIAACPILQKIPNVVIVHGESGGSLEMLKVCNKLGHLCLLPCYDVPCFRFPVSLLLSMSRLSKIKFYNMFRQGSPQDGCCISHLFRYRMVFKGDATYLSNRNSGHCSYCKPDLCRLEQQNSRLMDARLSIQGSR